jgi:hypothetical protein
VASGLRPFPEPEYDVASFLWNPLPYRMLLDVTERRLSAFAGAGLDEARMRAWAVIRGAYLGADGRDDGAPRACLGGEKRPVPSAPCAVITSRRSGAR